MAEPGCIKDGHFQNLEVEGNIVKNGTMNRIKVNGAAQLSTLVVTGDTTLSGSLTVTGATTLSDTLADDDTTLSDTLTVTGATTLSNTLAVTGATTLSDTLTVTGGTILEGDLHVVGGLTIPDLATTTSAPTAGAGINGIGLEKFHKSSVVTIGNIIYTTIFLDLRGLTDHGSNTIIGLSSSSGTSSHIGEIEADVSGTIFGGRMTCLITPLGGTREFILYSAAADLSAGWPMGTGSSLAFPSGGTYGTAWDGDHALNVSPFSSLPHSSFRHLYLVSPGNSGPAAALPYDQGRILIEMWGYKTPPFG
jgi:hypothetical protein